MAPQPFIPLTDGAQVEIVFVLGGEPCENRLWFTTDAPPITQEALDGLAQGVFAWHTANILPYLSSDIQLAAVEAKEWTATPPPFISVAGPPTNGGTADESHSANVAVVVPFRWPLSSSRLKKNKNFLPGIPKSAVDTNRVTDAFSDAMFEAYAALIDAARLFSPILTWRWVVTSRRANNAYRSEQFARECIGPPNNLHFVLGQRRKRLP